MSHSVAAKKALSSRYQWAKLVDAGEVFLDTLLRKSDAQQAGFANALSLATTRFQETYNKQLTSTILLAGAAMAPGLNAAALSDKSAVEKLVVRLISRPSRKTVAVGDVVAFHSPLAASGPQNVLVRRVAALEAQEMVSDEPGDDEFSILPSHCWVLADSEKLQPPDVIDSRSFGQVPMDNIIGRIIYHFRTKADHGPVLNSVQSTRADFPILEQEVDLDVLAGPGPGPGPGPAEQQQAKKGRAAAPQQHEQTGSQE